MDGLQQSLHAANAHVATSQNEIDKTKEELATYKHLFSVLCNIGKPGELMPSPTTDPYSMLENLQNDISNIPSQHIALIRQEATRAHTSITALEDKVSYIDNTIQNVSYDLNKCEQWLKEWNILIHGLKDLPVRPKDSEKRYVFEFHFIEHICNQLNDLIGDKLYKNLQPNDIERAHILYQGTKSETKPVVIVRFVRRVVRNNVFFNRRWLKGTKIAITDHLSKFNKALYQEAKGVFGSEHTWTSLGVVKANVGGKVRNIRSYRDIDNWANPHQFRYQTGNTC